MNGSKPEEEERKWNCRWNRTFYWSRKLNLSSVTWAEPAHNVLLIDPVPDLNIKVHLAKKHIDGPNLWI